MGNLVADAGAATDIGRRTRQEDAVISDFSLGAPVGLAVLSDGMGGHDDGDLASRIIVSEMFGELFFSGARVSALTRDVPRVMKSALSLVNKRLARHTKSGTLSTDTGGTLLSVALIDNALSWISVGDSPLYLFRDNELARLNENHSFAPQIDMMVREGVLDAKAGRNHPQRSCLTSAVTGASIREVDCPNEAMPLRNADIVLLASDGLNVLSDDEIKRQIRRNRFRTGQGIATALLNAALACKAPDQDNIALVVIKLKRPRGPRPAPRAPLARLLPRPLFEARSP